MIWELFICFGLTGWGCGGWHVVEYPSAESCYHALANMVRDEQKVVAYCRPKEKK